MYRRIWVEFAAAKFPRVAISFILLILVGRTSNANAQTVTILYSFGGYPNDGHAPVVALVQGSDGNFYGTTYEGGNTNLAYGYGYGRCFGSVPAVPIPICTPLAAAPPMGKIHKPGWCKAVTAISTERPRTAGAGTVAISAAARCFGSVPAVPTPICTPSEANATMGAIHKPGWSRVVTAICMERLPEAEVHRRDHISDQSQRQRNESTLLCRLPKRWCQSRSRVGAGQ